MLKAIGNYFKAPPILPVTDEKEVIDKKYKKYRIDVFSASFIGYTVFHLTKKNIGPALPAIQEEFGYSNLQLGLLGSSLYFTYAFGKFINGMIADKADAKKFMTAALMISALSNILLGFSPQLVNMIVSVFPNLEFIETLGQPLLLLVMAFCWGVNGWFQSMGFPGIAKSLAFWWSNKERGTVWSLWTTSHQLGTCLAFVLAGYLIPRLGWQAAFIVPGVINLIVCIYLYTHMHDKPESLGLPDVEIFKEGKKEEVEELEKRQQEIERKMSKMQSVIDNIEKDIYAEDGFDFEIVCPYCNHEFIIDVDENKTEIECPECNNLIELDWSGDVDDEPSAGGCLGDCHGCHGCGSEDEDDDM